MNAFVENLLTGYDAPFYVVLSVALILTPLLSIFIIAPVFEGRRLPLDPKNGQFYTFVYGDIALAAAATILVVVNQAYDFVPLANWWMGLAGVVTVVVALIMTAGEYAAARNSDEYAYAPRAVLSPTKLYHNLVLYGGYVWLLVMLLTESVLIIIHNPEQWIGGSIMIAAALFFAGLWGYTMILDEQSSSDQKRLRADKAHIANWQPQYMVIVVLTLAGLLIYTIAIGQ